MASKNKDSGRPYYPYLNIGLKNNYIYYRSLLSSTRVPQNYIIGEQAREYLREGDQFSLNRENSKSIIFPALDLIYKAAINERTKETAWVNELCKILNIKQPANGNDFDYPEFIAILNKVQKNHKNALAAIAAEQERLSRIDFNKLLEAKKQQRALESQARSLERKGLTHNNKGQTPDEIREEGAKQYFDAIKEMGGQQYGKNDLTAFSSKLELIRQSIQKTFISSRSNFTSKIVDKILPIATKAITIVNGDKPHFNPSLLNEITQQLIMYLVNKIISEELTNEDFSDGKPKTSKFLKSNRKTQGNVLERTLDSLLVTDEGQEELSRLASQYALHNSFTSMLELEYESNTQSALFDQYKTNSDRAKDEAAGLLRHLRQNKENQRAFEQTTHKKWNAKSKKSTEQYDDFLRKKYELDSSFTRAAIRELTTGCMSGQWFYSEQRAINDIIEQTVAPGIQQVMIGHSFRPQDFPKADLITGYLGFNINLDETPMNKKIAQLKAQENRLKQSQDEMDKLSMDLFNSTNYSKANLQRHIGKGASVKTYEENAKAFIELRQEQLAILDEMAAEIKQQDEQLEQVFTRFNVLTTVKDQDGLLSPRRGSAIGAKGKNLVEAGFGFSGGAMGTNDMGLSALDNLVALGQQGLAMSERNIEWLRFALLNSGLGLIGYSNRSSLENYFSMFASFLMFDDAQLIISDAINERAKEIGKQNTVQEIHLYLLNGIYYPQSYILFELHKHLSEAIKNATFSQRNLSKSTVRTQIYSYNVGSKYPGNTKKDWIREANAAASTVKIKMYFLMNMADIVNQIYKKAFEI